MVSAAAYASGTSARLGKSEFLVVEADESDGPSSTCCRPIAVVTNIDREHLEHFKTFDAVQDAFRAFVENVPFYGFSVMCTDRPVAQSLVGRIEDHRMVTYGENPQADVRLVDVSHAGGTSLFTIVFRDRTGNFLHEIKNLALPMPGRHNALNATAAIAVAHELGIGDDVIRHALANFGGVRRRFTRTGMWNGVTIVDDYGHHPVEIASVLRAAREFDRRRCHRRGAAASLYAAAGFVRAVLHLLQRRRHRDRRAGLFGRRSADRGRGSRIPWCRACAKMGTGKSSRWTAQTGCICSFPAWRSRAMMWCASAPARSRSGLMPCPASWRRQPSA